MLSEAFPPLRSIESLPKLVLVVAPHPDDEVLGCGGLLALLAKAGAKIRIVIVTDGASGSEQRVTRQAESRAAAAELGVEDLRFMGRADGGLGDDPELCALLGRELSEYGPELVLAPGPLELHPDHRATCSALIAALTVGPTRRVLFYGVNRQVPATLLLDTTSARTRKRKALKCFESQAEYHDIVKKSEAFDRAYTMNIDDEAVQAAEGFVDLSSRHLRPFGVLVSMMLESQVEQAATAQHDAAAGLPTTTAVISTWNKADDVRENLMGLRAQVRPFTQVIVVDNASSDGTGEMIAREFPEVRLIAMPHSRYGACETFNIGFASSMTELTAILDDDVVLPPDWLEKTTKRMLREPSTTAIVSTKIVEPGMPESYKLSPEINRERYMSTFRGCASLARTAALREVGGYDERLFIYGNERDLTCRLLNLGYRVLQYPEAQAFHKTPFGIKMGKRSLYYHARNAWIGMLKYAPLADLLRMPLLVVRRVLLRGRKAEVAGEVTDATGTIGIASSVRETPGAWWVLVKALCSVIYNIPYCLKRREPVRAPDFELPLK